MENIENMLRFPISDIPGNTCADPEIPSVGSRSDNVFFFAVVIVSFV